MEKIRRYLLEKGWKKRDIGRAIRIIRHAKKHKHPKIRLLDKSVYWISFIIAVIGNFIMSIALIPELLTLRGFQLYLIIIVLGLSFGLLFELLVRGIENLEAKHHIFLGIIIPVIAVINFIIVSNNIKSFVGIDNPHDPLIVGSVYAISFILPYISYQVFLKDKY